MICNLMTSLDVEAEPPVWSEDPGFGRRWCARPNARDMRRLVAEMIEHRIGGHDSRRTEQDQGNRQRHGPAGEKGFHTFGQWRRRWRHNGRGCGLRVFSAVFPI